MNKLLSLAMEAIDTTDSGVEQVSETPPAQGNTKREDELVLYAKITDFEGLKAATGKESQEQWEVKSEYGRIRVRKTSKEGIDPTFDLTFKTKSSNAGIEGNLETTYDIDEAMFESFKQISENGMVKDRFFYEVAKVTVKNASGMQDIQVTDMFYETDVFFNEDGSYNENVKIDLEVNKLLDKINETHKDIGEFNLIVKVMHLPFKPKDVILSKNASESDKKIIQNLYDTVFLKKK